MSEQVIQASPGPLTRSELNEDRRVKRLAAIVLALLILLVALLLFYFMFFKIKGKESQGIRWIFSIYNLRGPHGVTSDGDKNAYISDTGNHRFLVFNSSGKFVKEIGKKGEKDGFYQPYGSFVDDKADRIYICDWTARKVVVVNKAGKRLSTFPEKSFDNVFGPKGFTPYQIDEYKGNLYITSNNGIYVFDKKGNLKKNWGQRGRKVGEYMFPNGIAVDQKTGNIFVADVLNRRVVSLNNEGKVRWIIGRPDKLVKAQEKAGSKGKAGSRGKDFGKLISFFQLPRSIAISPDGHVFVTDTFANQVIILTTEGELIGGVGKRGVGDGEFNFPEGIAFRDDGIAYIADRASDRVQAIEILEPYPKLDSGKRRLHKAQLEKF